MRYFLIAFSLTFSSFASESATKRVWVDGIYDLAHYGHQRSFEKARAISATYFRILPDQIHLIVGVCGGDIKAYKREPIMNLSQRINQIRSFKGVDEVISDTAITFDERYIDQYNLDLMMHGDDFSDAKAQQYYSGAIARGKFRTYPYEDGISTSDLIKRATLITLEALLEDASVNCEDKEAVRTVLSLVN